MGQEIEVKNGPPPPPPSKNSNFGFIFNNDYIYEILNIILPPILDDAVMTIGDNLPQNCCYGSKSSYKLYLTDMHIPPMSVKSSVNVVGGKNYPQIHILVDFNVKVHYKLCKPEVVTCVELWPCGGEATLGMKTNTQFELQLVAGPHGGPIFHYKEFHVHLDMKKNGVCLLLKTLLDTAMPFINIFLNSFVPKALSPLTHSISSLPHNISIPGPLPIDIDWFLTAGTGSKPGALAFQGILDILLAPLNYEKAPYLPYNALPLAAKQVSKEIGLLEFTDSLVNNIIWSLSHYFKDFEFDTKENGFKVKLTLPEAPLVNFTTAPGNQAAIMTLHTQIPLKIVVTSVETAHFAFLFNTHGQLYLSLDPKDFVVLITSMTPPQPNNTKNKIQNEVENAYASIVPQINEILAAHPISLPTPSEAHNPSIIYGKGYAKILYHTKRKSGKEEQEEAVEEEKTCEEEQQEIVEEELEEETQEEEQEVGEEEESPPIPIPVVNIIDPTQVDPANVIDLAQPLKVFQGQLQQSLSPATLHLFQILWESTHAVNPEEELLPLVETGLPKGSTRSCPNLPLFSSCH